MAERSRDAFAVHPPREDRNSRWMGLSANAKTRSKMKFTTGTSIRIPRAPEYPAFEKIFHQMKMVRTKNLMSKPRKSTEYACTLEEVADALFLEGYTKTRVSQQRVRQIELVALAKIKSYLEKTEKEREALSLLLKRGF